MMCRAFLILDTEKGRKDEAKFQVVMNYVVNAKNHGNKDGYFISIDGNKFRTLNYDNFLDFVVSHEKEINEANCIAGHLRLATAGAVIEKWIHGWKFDKYECFHNGCLYEYKENDSYEFFKQINFFNCERIVEVANTNSGWGVFMMSDYKGNKYVLSKSTSINIHLVNKHFYAINSNDDIHDLKSEVDYSVEVEDLCMGVLVFENSGRKLSVGDYVYDDIKLSVSNCVIKFDELNRAVETLEIEKEELDYNYVNNVSAEAEWFDEEEKKDKEFRNYQNSFHKKKKKGKKKKVNAKQEGKIATVISEAMEDNYWDGYADGYGHGYEMAKHELDSKYGTLKEFDKKQKKEGVM